MMRGMYSAISGLKNHQVMLDVTANDLANVNTVGFKASRVSFRDSLAQYVGTARKVGGRSGGRGSARRRSGGGDNRTAQIREWARSNGAATLTVGGQTNIDPGKVFQVR